MFSCVILNLLFIISRSIILDLMVKKLIQWTINEDLEVDPTAAHCSSEEDGQNAENKFHSPSLKSVQFCIYDQ